METKDNLQKHSCAVLGSCCIVIAFVLFVTAMPVFAQLPTGTILGVVKDSSGAVIPGTLVTVHNDETGLSRNVMASADGGYRFAALPVGHYMVKFEKVGFKMETQTGLVLDVAQEMVVNSTLQVGATTQEVVVTGEASLVNTTSSSLGGLVNEEKVADLPLNGRNYINLSLLQTGVTQSQPQGVVAGMVGTFFSSNGAPTRSNNYMLDGASMVNFYGLGTSSAAGTTLGVDGIQEYKVVTNSFGAEYGQTMGSQMIIVSKSGTNHWHGDAFEYLRNAVLDARNFFDYGSLLPGGRRLPNYVRNNFGGALGGPIVRDKVFVFGVYEGLRERLGTTNVLNVLAPGCHGGLGAMITNTACPQLGSTPSVTIGSASPAVVPLIALDAPSNLSNNRNTYGFSQPANESYGQIRVDDNLSSSDSLFVRYTIDDAYLERGRAFLLYLDTWLSRNQYLTVSENHIFSPALINTARISGSRTHFSTTTTTPYTGSQYSFLPGNTLGAVTVGGLDGFGPDAPTPQRAVQNLFTFSDDVFYNRGRHALKFGTLVNYYQQFVEVFQLFKGTISFSSVPNFLQGIPLTLSGTVPGSIPAKFYTFDTFGFYAQDDYRASSRLTLNLGLRYEFMTTPIDRDNRGAALRNILTDASTTIGPPIQDPSYRNFSPRVGFAWDVRGNGKTSIRSGVGFMYDVANLGSTWARASTGTPPFTNRFTIQSPGSFTLPFTIPAGAVGKFMRSVLYTLNQPKLLQGNLTVQQQLPFASVLSVAYAFSRGYDLLQDFEGNPVTTALMDSNGVKNWPASTAACANVVPTCRQNPNWGSLDLIRGNSRSWYNALQVELTKKVSHGLQLQSAYTFGKLIDMGQSAGVADGDGTGQDPQQPLLNKGPALFDVTQNWRFNVLYRVPGPARDDFVGKILGGWWLSSIVSVQTGYPFTPLVTANRSNSTYGNDRPNLSAGSATLGVNNFIAYDASSVILGNPTHWFNPLMFTLPPQGYLGNAGRDILRGPGLRNWDFSVVKGTRMKFLGEAGNLEFRAEFFNLLNKANFAMPNATVFAGTTAGSGVVEAPLSTAGSITATTTSARQIQLALKVIF